MKDYNEHEIKNTLSYCFSEPVEIAGIGFFPENLETGFTEDTILFNVAHTSDKKGVIELEYKEVFMFQIDWDEMRMECAISTKDYEKLSKQSQGKHSYLQVFDTFRPDNKPAKSNQNN